MASPFGAFRYHIRNANSILTSDSAEKVRRPSGNLQDKLYFPLRVWEEHLEKNGFLVEKPAES